MGSATEESESWAGRPLHQELVQSSFLPWAFLAIETHLQPHAALSTMAFPLVVAEWRTASISSALG